jgi:hypothetical protein
LLVLYGRSRNILSQLQELRQFAQSQDAAHWVLGYWNSPEDPGTAIRMRRLGNVQIINNGDSAALTAFVGRLMERGGQA